MYYHFCDFEKLFFGTRHTGIFYCHGFSITFYSAQRLSANTAQKIKFSIIDFFSKCEQIHSFLWLCSHLPKKEIFNKKLHFVCSKWSGVLSTKSKRLQITITLHSYLNFLDFSKEILFSTKKSDSGPNIKLSKIELICCPTHQFFLNIFVINITLFITSFLEFQQQSFQIIFYAQQTLME